MRILIVTDAWYPQVNGVVRTYEYLRAALMAMGHDVKIVGPADFPFSMPMPGYPEIRLAILPGVRLRRVIRDYRPDLLHVATEGPLGIAARAAAARYHMAFTSCYHTHFPDYVAKRVARFVPALAEPTRKAAISFIRWFHEPSACVFAATESLRQTLLDWRIGAPIRLMTRGIDHGVFHTGGKARCFAALARPVALYVGRVAIEKNLEAFLGMDWDGSKVVVGTGPDSDLLARKYPHAHFAGVKSGAALADCYRSADLFVFPSRTDTFGLVVVEALACGLPVAAYPVSGPADIVNDDRLGVLDEDLSVAARVALKADGTREERAEIARARYDWRLAAEQFLDWR